MLNNKNVGQLIKQNSNIICSYDMLRACTFRACRLSLLSRYTRAYERACNLLRRERYSVCLLQNWIGWENNFVTNLYSGKQVIIVPSVT